MRLRSRLAAAALVAACTLVPLGSAAEDPPKPGAAPAEQPICGRDLMTPEERTAHREKLRSLATPEERAAYRAEHHAKMLERAKERGVELPGAGCPQGRGMGGGGMGMGPGGGGPGPGPGPRRP
jgi:hypothetical protein